MFSYEWFSWIKIRAFVIHPKQDWKIVYSFVIVWNFFLKNELIFLVNKWIFNWEITANTIEDRKKNVRCFVWLTRNEKILVQEIFGISEYNLQKDAK